MWALMIRKTPVATSSGSIPSGPPSFASASSAGSRRSSIRPPRNAAGLR